MLWPMLAIALGFLGVAVLAVLAVRVFVEVRRLSGQVAESSRRITAAGADLERAAADLARTGRATVGH
jgi:Tfp pilus assembly protein PilX